MRGRNGGVARRHAGLDMVVGWALVVAAVPALAASPAAAAEPTVLERALAALPGHHVAVPAGPYSLYTDLDNPKLLRRLTRLAPEIEPAYRRRYGLDPRPATSEAIVLYSRTADFRRFASEAPAWPGFEKDGWAGSGVAALTVEGADDAQIASLLVHELTHLINGRTFRSSPPPWLEEGMAYDLSYSRIDRVGRFFPGTLSGRSSVSGWPIQGPGLRGPVQLQITRTGGFITLAYLVRLLGHEKLPSLAVVTHLSRRQLVDPGGQDLAFAVSTFFVRYLLDGGEQDLTAAFRRFLATLAGGGAGDAETLRRGLGRRWEDLDSTFKRWLRTVDVNGG